MNGETANQGDLIREISYPLYNCRGWLKFLGVMSIISGVIQVFTIIGIIFAWLPIWIGVLLFQAASAVERAYETGDSNEINVSLSKLKTYFMIMGVISLLGVIFLTVMFFTGSMAVLFSNFRFMNM